MLNMSRNHVIRGDRVISNATQAERRAVSRGSMRRGMDVLASPAFGGANPHGFAVSQVTSTRNTVQLMLEGILSEDPRIKRKVFRDIYYHDAIAGGAVDMYASLPWSDFHLEGVNDKAHDVIDVYHTCLSKLHLKTFLPGLTRDFHVLGQFIGSANFDKREKIFTSIIPQSIDSCRITEVPIFGIPPLVDLVLPKSLLKLFGESNKDERVKGIIENIPEEIRDRLKEGVLPLNPENTIYIARRTMTSDTMGTSYYERILPVHLLEKVLFRGTIDQAYRRQRAILHVTMGGDDDWIPTPDDMNVIRDMFLQADMDPTGAVLVTRTGISPTEVRMAQDFWRVDEIYEFASAVKYSALRMSQDIIMGTATLSTLDASLSIMIDDIRTFREMVTRELFYDKLFPELSASNDFRNEDRPHSVLGSSDMRPTMRIHGRDIDVNDLIIPKIVWHKHLNPEGDSAYLEILELLSQRGVPIPLSLMAAAGGINLNQLLDGMDEDIKTRKKVDVYMEKIMPYIQRQAQLQQMINQPPEGQDGGQGGQGDMFASLDGDISTPMEDAIREAVTSAVSENGVTKPMGVLNREYPEFLQPHETDSSGRYRIQSVKGKVKRRDDTNRTLARFLAQRAKAENDALRRRAKDGQSTSMSHGTYGRVS